MFNVDERCPEHADRRDEIAAIAKSVNRQSGQWAVLFIILCVLLVAVWNKDRRFEENVSEIHKAVTRIELQTSQYIAQHIQESSDGFRRIKHLEDAAGDHQSRITTLEFKVKALENR